MKWKFCTYVHSILEEVRMGKAQYAILRFAKYASSSIGNIEAHNERTKENMPVIQILIWNGVI